MQGKFDSQLANTPAVDAVAVGTAVQATGKIGVSGSAQNGVGVTATNAGQGIGLRATSDDGWAVNAQSKTGIGVLGVSDTNVGVEGICQQGGNFGVSGTGANAGIAAFNANNSNAAYLASACCAGWFTGGVTVTGKLSKGGGGFRIDHPVEPDKKYLSHSFVESPDMKNMYDGIVVTDKKGTAMVSLPDWFEILNEDFRYQLTAVGSHAPNLHIAKEIHNNQFTIAGGAANMKVSWQITGIRKDKWAQANRIGVEEEKDPAEYGHYLHPEHFGENAKGIGELRHLPVRRAHESSGEFGENK